MRRAKSDAPSAPIPAPPTPPSTFVAPRAANGSLKIVSYPMIVVGIMLTAAAVLGILRFVKGKGDATPAVAASTNAASVAGAPNDDAALVARVSKLISVNPNETPTIATVQDPESLRAQNASFYKEAEIGDRLLLWSDKAVLYSQKRDMILNVIMISASPSAQGTASTPSAEVVKENVVIEVRNGSGVAGLGKTAAKRLSDLNLHVLPATNAGIKGAQKTIIVVPNGGSYPATVLNIQRALGVGEVVMSTTETDLKGDILVVTGLDFTP